MTYLAARNFFVPFGISSAVLEFIEFVEYVEDDLTTVYVTDDGTAYITDE